MTRAALTLAFYVGLAASATAAELGDDGLHKTDWMRDTFKDLREDHAEAQAEGKRLAVIVEQRGCAYCTKVHEEVFPDPAVDSYIRDKYFFVQLNLFGDVDVTDFDGETLPEKDMAGKWGVLFTPTLMLFPAEIPDEATAPEAAVAVMPGAFSKHTILNLLRWVAEDDYKVEPSFQKYHASRLDGAIVE
jgi:thioredoxin-related protein